MLTLRSSSTSPFGRKVKVAALLTGHTSKITIATTDTMNADDPIRRDNPLGKIPCLVLEDGSTVYDSRVIIEYLDQDAGGDIVIPKAWPARLAALKMQALADGIMDAAILKLYEGRFRKPEMHDATWLAYQGGKVDRGMAALEANPPRASAKPDIGVITVACMLEWLDFRFAVLTSGKYPALAGFLADMQTKLPGFSDSKPKL